jgi:hypothetical protein
MTPTSAMSQTASTPPTTLLNGGNASADSFNERREVKRRSGREAEVRDERDLSFEVGNAGFLPHDGKGSRIGGGFFCSNSQDGTYTVQIWRCIQRFFLLKTMSFARTAVEMNENVRAVMFFLETPIRGYKSGNVMAIDY